MRAALVSIYDSMPTHVIDITPQIKTRDATGNDKFIDGDTIPNFACRIQPVSEERSTSLGVVSESVVSVGCTRWPGGPYFTFTDTATGEKYRGLTNPKRFRSSLATAHDRVYAVMEEPHG